MKVFKNPVFAVLLAIVVVIASTLINVNVKFGRKCDAVSDLFYEGVPTRGYTQSAIASDLENISAYADGLVTIARNYDIDSSAVGLANDRLKSSVQYSHSSSMRDIHSNYADLCTAVSSLIDSLERAELSERDASGVSQYRSSLVGAQSAIGESGYNDAVREFLRKYDHFPTDVLAALAGLNMPETFN